MSGLNPGAPTSAVRFESPCAKAAPNLLSGTGAVGFFWRDMTNGLVFSSTCQRFAPLLSTQIRVPGSSLLAIGRSTMSAGCATLIDVNVKPIPVPSNSVCVPENSKSINTDVKSTTDLTRYMPLTAELKNLITSISPVDSPCCLLNITRARSLRLSTTDTMLLGIKSAAKIFQSCLFTLAIQIVVPSLMTRVSSSADESRSRSNAETSTSSSLTKPAVGKLMSFESLSSVSGNTAVDNKLVDDFQTADKATVWSATDGCCGPTI